MKNLSQAAANFDNDFANVLGEGVLTEFKGLTWNVRFLDVLDLKEFRKTFSSEGDASNGLDLNTGDIEQVTYLFYLVLRKSDPRVTTADILAEKWNLTLTQVGRLLTMKALTDPDVQAFLQYLLVGSGLRNTPEEAAEAAKN